MTRSNKYWEKRLTPKQRLAAQYLVDNEFGLLSEDGKKLSMEKVAEKVGCGRTTLFEWRRLPEFQEYMNEIADKELNYHRAEVYAALMKAVRGGSNGIPSAKAIDLYLRRFGLLTDRTEVDDRRQFALDREKLLERIRERKERMNRDFTSGGDAEESDI